MTATESASAFDITAVASRSASPPTDADDVHKGPVGQASSMRGRAVVGVRRLLPPTAFRTAVVINMATFIIPSLYSFLLKLWIAQLDYTAVATTDAYTYLGIVAEVVNEGLPRAAGLVIGDLELTLPRRLQLICTLLIVQIACGTVLSVIFCAAAKELASAFVPPETWRASIRFIRITAFSTVFGCTDYAIGTALRAFDRPDVPLMISTAKTVVNMVLDMVFLSNFRVYQKATVDTQATVRICCDASGTICGLLYFVFTVVRRPQNRDRDVGLFDLRALMALARPGLWLFLESALRNALYLWLMVGIVSLGLEYATAWGVFMTIRWGLVMVPTNAFAESTIAFTGHRWGRFVARKGAWREAADMKDIKQITHYARLSAVVIFVLEGLLLLSMSLWLVEPMAVYLSNNRDTARLTAKMWRTVDWAYLLFCVSLQFSAVLQVTCPTALFGKTVIANVGWVLPWAVAIAAIHVTSRNAWTYHAMVFGGSLVVDFVVIGGLMALWVFVLQHPHRMPRSIRRLLRWVQHNDRGAQ